MSDSRPRGERRLQIVGLLAGTALLAVGGAVAFGSPVAVLRAYLVAWAYWWTLAVGGLGLACLHQTTSGRWGLVTSRAFEAMARTLPLLGLAFAPVLLRLGDIYPWYGVDAETLGNRAMWLNPQAFFGRTTGYFVVWTVLAWTVSSWSGRRDSAPKPEQRSGLIKLGAAGLLLFVLTTSFAALDWFMSLEPDWYSTIYGALFIIDAGLIALAVGILTAWSRRDSAAMREYATVESWTDLGNLLLAFTMVWAYFHFSQFLIIWSADLPVESVWYLKRGTGGWLAWANLVVVAHFLVPFFLLLSRPVRRTPDRLARVAAWILIAHLAHLFWMLAPAFGPGQWTLWWMVPVLWAGIGGLWVSLFLWQLGAKAYVPLNDPAAVRHRERTANGSGSQHHASSFDAEGTA